MRNCTKIHQSTFSSGNKQDTERKIQTPYEYLHRRAQERVGYAVVCEEQTIKRKIHPQNSIYSAEQSVIIKVIYSPWNKERPKVKTTDSFITMMGISDRKRTKNPKTHTIRKLMDQQRKKSHSSGSESLWVSQATRTQIPQPK
jgi:hypothetical protein